MIISNAREQARLRDLSEMVYQRLCLSAPDWRALRGGEVRMGTLRGESVHTTSLSS